ncbi:MAG: T9SS type A sorting domain-containing protein [Ignavibacteria bacterium]|nr:T9SS type A sorting domain-containing protein [Ignavibacteria bacterium]
MNSIFKDQIAAMFVIWFLFLSADFSLAADTVSAKYFPLVVGNSYTYLNSDNFFQQWRTKASITKDTIINNKKYFYCKGFPGIKNGSWVRYDSSRSNLLIYTGGASCSNYSGEIIMDSLAMSVNNSINCSYDLISLRRCTAIGNQTVFGQVRQTKTFLHDGLIYSRITYSEGIGITSFCSGEPPPCQGYTNLIGCVMNGVVMGDTLLTDIEQTNTTIPDKFYLSQNYPNPFNPETVISFAVPKSSFVSLKIYNAVGVEMTTLINEEIKSGYYNYKWNGQNLPSGIYYYKMTSGEFTETRKMILVK